MEMLAMENKHAEADRTKSADHLELLREVTDPLVRQWLARLLEHGERASGTIPAPQDRRLKTDQENGEQ
jgi:hypothetical protein